FEAERQRDVLDLDGCKARQLRGQVVTSWWKAAEAVPAIGFRDDRARDATFSIAHGDGYAGEHTTLGVGDDPGDHRVCHLRAGWQRQPEENCEYERRELGDSTPRDENSSQHHVLPETRLDSNYLGFIHSSCGMGRYCSISPYTFC